MNNPQENIQRFEEIVAEFTGAKYAVATDSCTNSIFLCLKYLSHLYSDLSPVVRVPKHTYLSVPQAVMHAGYDVQFTDNEWEGDYSLPPYPVIDSATRFEKDMYKHPPCDFTYTVPVMMCTSFHIKKQIAIGRGGMILTDDSDAVNWLKQARYDGRKGAMFNDIDDIEVLGYHMYMTPEQAARGIELFYGVAEFDGCTWEDYPDVSKYSCFDTKKDSVQVIL